MHPIINRGIMAGPRTVVMAGITAILEDSFGVKIAAKADSFSGLLDVLRIDAASGQGGAIVFLDDTLAGLSRIEALCELRILHPQIRIAVLASMRGRQAVLDSLGAGAHGYVPKDLPEDELAAAFTTLLAGRLYVPAIVADLSPPASDAWAPAGYTAGITEPLTGRQRDVLDLLVVGKSNKEIGRALRIAESTVKIHVTGAFRRLGVRTRIGAIARMQALARQLGPSQPTFPGLIFERRQSG